jgi:predicted DNA-binding transcriptional regulator YafY
LRKGLRSFAVDAIVECELLEVEAKEFDPEMVRENMQEGYGIFGGKVKDWAKLKFSPERSRWVQFEEWHPDQRKTINGDGSVVMEIPYSDEREILGDILRYGSDVEVVSPPSLRTSVLMIVEKMKTRYESYK